MAWTITTTIDARVSICPMVGSKAVVVKLACVSDANASGTYNIKTGTNGLDGSFAEILGSTLKYVKFVPGTGDDAPSAAFDFDVEDGNNDHILDTDSNTHTANSFVLGLSTLGEYPRIFNDLSVVIGTLGDANTADIYMYFEKF